MPPVEALLALARWPNVLLSAAGVIIGAWWAGGAPLGVPAVLGAASAAALTVLANAFNDACDAAIDARAHPDRPIPRGAISAATAIRIAAIAGMIALALALAVGLTLVLVTAAVVVLMLAYSLWMKRGGVIGNVLVAGLASFPFVYGALCVGRPDAAYPLMALAAPLHFGREVAKDLDDMAGDRGRRATIPVSAGADTARAVVALSGLMFAALVAGSVKWWPDLVLPGLVALPPVMVATWRVMKQLPGAPAMFKLAMVAAVAALAVTLAT